MVFVPEGIFWMGCNAELPYCASEWSPLHQVNVASFWIDVYEVTVLEYASCVESGVCSEPNVTSDECNNVVVDERRADTNNWISRAQRTNHPINCVDWHQAKMYCEWVGKRLPTEAEWEKAARGIDGRTYPWGNEPSDCNYAVTRTIEEGSGCGQNLTWPVGSKIDGASIYGTLDMAGNVAEWTADWYDAVYYYKGHSDNPSGPEKGKARVARGGMFYSSQSQVQSFARLAFPPDKSAKAIGFRCAKSTHE